MLTVQYIPLSNTLRFIYCNGRLLVNDVVFEYIIQVFAIPLPARCIYMAYSIRLKMFGYIYAIVEVLALD